MKNEISVLEYVRNTTASDPNTCACGGFGWISTPQDAWKRCPSHYTGQPHPEDSAWNHPEETKSPSP